MDGTKDLMADGTWRVLAFMTGPGGLWLAGLIVAGGVAFEGLVAWRALSRWRDARRGRLAGEVARAALAAASRKGPERVLVRNRVG